VGEPHAVLGDALGDLRDAFDRLELIEA